MIPYKKSAMKYSIKKIVDKYYLVKYVFEKNGQTDWGNTTVIQLPNIIVFPPRGSGSAPGSVYSTGYRFSELLAASICIDAEPDEKVDVLLNLCRVPPATIKHFRRLL